MRRVYGAVDLQSAWYTLVRDLMRTGRESAPRGMRTREFIGVNLVLTDPAQSIITDPERKLNQAFAAAEFCWIMAGDDRADLISTFNSKVAEYADQDCGLRFFGAYGPKIVAQLPYVLESLQKEDSRQAVVNIWRESPPPTRDVPCTLSLQFLLRDGALTLVTVMRSNDVWLGTPYDVQTFTRLQSWVASQLGCELGEYHHVVGSMHLYERNFEAAQRVIAATSSSVRLPGRVEDRFDPKTNPAAAWRLLRTGWRGDPQTLGVGWSSLYRTMSEYLDRKAERAS